MLRGKPGALPGSTALAHARAAGTFTAEHEAFWAAARKTDGDAAATRELIDVLLLHRSLAADDVIAGIAAALTVGAMAANIVAVEARRHAATGGRDSSHPPVAQPHEGERRVVSLTQRRLADPTAVIAGLPPDNRPLPSVVGYDELLTRRTPQFPEAPTQKEDTGT